MSSIAGSGELKRMDVYLENRRIWEIDVLRALAITLMVIFHIVFDLNQFVGMSINYKTGFWYWEGKVSALIFIFLAGISCGFSKNNVIRGIKVLAFAMVITLTTYIVFGDQYVRFGILHFLGISMILFPLLRRINSLVLFISAITIGLAAIRLENALAETSLLLPFGVMYGGFSSVDYYPLIPYLAVFILGILAYKMYYYQRQSMFNFSYENEFLKTISKNSLLIYLLHQPIIVGAIYLLKLLTQYL